MSEEIAVYGCVTSQDKKRWLRRYSGLNREVEHIDRQIDTALQEIEAIRSTAERTTTTLTGMPAGGGFKSREDIYIKLADLSEEVDRQVDRFVEMRKQRMAQRAEISMAIVAIEDYNLKKVLMLRYCMGWQYEEIAVEMGYCIRQIWRFHGQALNKLVVV